MTNIVRRALNTARRYADSVQSLVTGLGVAGEDKAVDSRPAPIAWLLAQELDWLAVNDPIIGRMIHALPEDALAEGWRTDVGGDTDVSQELDEELGLEAVALEADYAARQYGGCYSLVIRDGVQDLSKPLDRPAKILQIHPLMAIECIANTWDYDLRRSTWGTPIIWDISVSRPGFAMSRTGVHRDHLVYMPGLPLRPTQSPIFLGYQLSVGQAAWEAARDLGLARRSTALAVMELSMLNLNLRGGQTIAGGDAEMEMRDALRLLSIARSTKRTNVTLGDDTLSLNERSLSGLAPAVQVMYASVAAREGWPLTILLGQPPGGMTSDDASARKQYAGMVRKHRRTRIQPWLRQVYDKAGPPQPSRVYVWPNPDPASALEKAQASAARATRDVALLTAGVITLDESRARFEGDEEIEEPVLDDSNGGDVLDLFGTATTPNVTATAAPQEPEDAP